MLQFHLIESPEYYKRRRWLLILQLLVLPLPAAILVNAVHYPIYVSVLAGVFFLAGIWINARNFKRYRQLTSKRQLKLSEDTLQISGTSSMAPLIIQMSTVEEVTIPVLKEMPAETFSGLYKEIRGEGPKCFIRIKIQGQEYRFDFVIDSYYHLNQLEKLVQHWLGQGMKVNRLET